MSIDFQADLTFHHKIDIYLHQANESALQQALAALDAKTGALAGVLAAIHQQGVIMANEIQDVSREVGESAARITELSDAINGLVAKVIELRTDPAALAAFAGTLESAQRSSDGALAAAQSVLNPTPPPAEPPAEPPLE